jgi:hypothetical protein
LWEMKYGPSWPNGTWYGSFSVPKSIAANGWTTNSAPSVLYDGSLFLISGNGELINMWWNGSAWIFLDNGKCGNQKATTVGAPMGNSKVFVTCSDGTLQQRWYDSANGGKWNWLNEGKPPSGYADTPPVTVEDGKLFLNVSNNSSGATTQKKLVEFYWDGTQWLWVDHGHPPGGWLLGAAASDPSSQHIYVRCQDGNYYEYSWSGGNWGWVNRGHP